MTVIFNGKAIRKPGAYSKIDSSGMVSGNTGSGRVLAIIGEADRGIPQYVETFNDPVHAKNVYKGGPLLTGAQIAWAPSGDLPGASEIKLIRVNKATQAETVIQDATSVDAIRLVSRDYGELTTYKYKVATGTSGGLIITITDGDITEVSPELDANNDTIVAWINENSSLVEATKLSDNVIDTTSDFVNFAASGTNPDPTSQDWQDCIDLLVNEDVDGILVMTSDETIHAYLNSHISVIGQQKKERRGFYGHADGEDVEAIKTRAKNLNSSKACLVTPGIKVSVDGQIESSSIYTACAIAGLWAGNSTSDEPLTLEYISCLGLDVLYTETEINDLIDTGVTVIEKSKNGYRIVRALTTYQTDNLLHKELFVDSLATDMDVELREHLETLFAGRKRTSTTRTSIYNATISKLNEFVRRGWLVEDVDDNGEVIPPYKNVVLRNDGTAWYVDWEGSIAVPDNFILITSHFSQK